MVGAVQKWSCGTQTLQAILGTASFDMLEAGLTCEPAQDEVSASVAG